MNMKAVDANIAEYEALEKRALGIYNEQLRRRMLELLGEATLYATVATLHRQPREATFAGSILPSAKDMGHARMKLNFTRAKRYMVEANIFRLDLTHDHDRKLVNALLDDHDALVDRITLINIQPELHTRVRNSYLTGGMEAIPFVPTVKALARRAYNTVSSTSNPNTSL